MKCHQFRAVTLNLLLLFAGLSTVRAQTGWDAYLARYDAGLGSVLVNMDIGRSAPHLDLPFLLITGVTYDDCTPEGFPGHREFKRLYRLSHDINRLIFETATRDDVSTWGRDTLSTHSLLAGTFTYQCQRLDYLYVADTVGLRENLIRLYTKKYGRYTFHIQMIHDPEWDAYRTFLYPNDAIRTFMMNDRAITRLKDAGDALSRPRFVEHRIYFDTREDREYFIRYIGRLDYDIKDEREMNRDSLRYQVLLARFGTVSLEEMNDQTTYLSTKAREFNGVYDGWQTKLTGSKQRFRLLYNPITESMNTPK
jgi:hypothetical protein